MLPVIISPLIRTEESNKPKLHFDYDAMGQRIVKTVTNKNVTMGDKFVTTYYVRDPQGSVLAVYEHKHGDSDNGTFTLTEQHLYGAGRLGMRKRDLALNATNTSETPATYYELTNHLGNVMAVISDTTSATDEPTVVSLSDYYPFGMTEPGRSWNSGDYRFGYTGHEKEEDLASGVYTTEYRLLDTRLGRWMNVDPLFAKYPGISPYNYCMGNPMKLIDPDGRDCNGGVIIVNDTDDWLVLGGVSGENEEGEEINYEYQYLILEPGQRLVPYQDGKIKKAKIMQGDEVIDDVYAYDVDYLQLQVWQTLTDSDNHRYSTDESDKDAVTPVSTWTQTEPDSDHTNHGDLKIRKNGLSGWLHKKGIEIYPGTIKFKNHYDANGNPDGIECDVDNGEDQEENGRANYFTPCIYPEKRQIPHTNPQPDDK